ncbi:MAG: DUF3108 domain-containing protein [Alphaproteobacteria bacterium]|nr:DUF3108 domain-containing protein [Alphaproteobacteria bacterium]
MVKLFSLFTSACFASAMLMAPVPACAADGTAVAPPGPVMATAPGAASNKIQLVWLVYVSGIKIGVVGLKSQFVPGGYAAVSNLKTGGIVGAFYDAHIEANSAGFVAGPALRPTQYNADATSKRRQITQLRYTASAVQLYANPTYNTKRFPVPDELKLNTLDPVSAMTFAISGISVSQQRPCGDTLHVFDGARRYDVEFRFINEVTLQSDEQGYGGPAVKCEVIYKQIAGFKPSVNQGKKTYPIYVWGAPFETSAQGPLKRFLVPVRIETETSFGTAKAIARKIAVDGARRTK